MKSSLEFKLIQPKGLLSPYIQGIWSASVHSSEAIDHWLHGDTCSGIIFNLGSTIKLGGVSFPTGVIALPVSKCAQKIYLPPGSKLVGLRFHPAIGVGVLGKRYDEPKIVTGDSKMTLALEAISESLTSIHGHFACITTLYRWLIDTLDWSYPTPIPTQLDQALKAIGKSQTPTQLCYAITISQRQIERQFQRWLGLTPKHYQRILRVKSVINVLREIPDSDLADLALSHGFSDQSHMTRECKKIAKITPKVFTKRVHLQHIGSDQRT